MTREQIQWIYNHVEHITNKYLNLFPLSDELWEQLLEEVKGIHKISKDNKVVAETMLVVLGYFEQLDKIYRREAKE